MRSTLKHWNGYYHNFPKVATKNIIYMTKMAIEESAEGVQSYASTDSTLDINNVAIAEYSWNFNGAGSVEDYINRYAFLNFSHQLKAAENAFSLYRTLTEERKERIIEIETSVSPNILNTVNYGAFGAIKPPSPKHPRCYPGEALIRMLDKRESYESKLTETEELANKTYLAMLKLTDVRDNVAAAREYATAARLYRDLAGDMLAILKMHDIIESGDKNARVKIMKLAEKRKLNRLEAMAIQEEISKEFLVSVRLKNQSVYFQLFADIEAYAKSVSSKNFKLNLFDTDSITSKRYIELR